MSLKLVLVLCAVWQASVAIKLFDINSATYRTLSKTDDGTALRALSPAFPFFGQSISNIHIGMNGIVSFGNPVTSYDTRGFPTSSYSIGSSSVMAFWSDTNGFFTGSVFHRPAVQQELTNFAAILKAKRAGLTNINLKYGIVIEWNDVTPCGCFFPKNTVQLALVTDGCASYAILGYLSVNWGNAEGARVGYIRINPNQHFELTASQNRNLQTLTTDNHVLYFGGENICTGHASGTFLTDPNNPRKYYVCGECSIARTIECEVGKKYDQQCQSCVVNAWPNCDRSVDGQWSAWKDSTTCSKTCKPDGTKTQSRTCTNPAPAHGGKDCVGLSTRTISCNTDVNCPINGGYGAWYDITQCTVNCGGGTKRQKRDCDKPLPQFGGLTCAAQNLGPSEQTVTCNSQNCPIDGKWGPWTNQGTCSKPCEEGQQKQIRVCIQPQFGGKPCPPGPTEQFITCNLGRCPDACTNIDGADNHVLEISSTRICLCLRLPDNSKSYIGTCIDCDPGLTYNRQFGVCTSPVKFECLAHPFCADKQPGDYSINHGKNTESCSHKFYRCDQDRQLTEHSCGVSTSGNYFNGASRQCVVGLAPASCPNNDCIGRTNGNYGRVNDLCKSFIQCSNFIEIMQNCPVATPYYRLATRTCVAGTGANGNDPPAGENCIDPDCHNKADGFYVVNNLCGAFYQCANDRQLQWTVCNAGFYYNAAIRQCQSSYPTNGLCQHKYCIQHSNGVQGLFQITGSSCGLSYSICSGSTSPNQVPNVMTSSSCLAGKYFHITNPTSFAGECRNIPAPQTCPNWQCIGRANGYREAFSGITDCRSYRECRNGIFTTFQCPVGQYFDPANNLCSSSFFNFATCQHPDCLAGGRQGGPGNYPLREGNQCDHSYYSCDSNRLRTTRSCPITLGGNYFGQAANQVWTCLTGKSPVGCSTRDCVGRTQTNLQTQTPYYDNAGDSYCTGYYSCPTTNGASVYGTCPNGGFLDESQYKCVNGRPGDQNCRVDGGISIWSGWSYVVGSKCSETCGTHGFQLQQRARACNNPLPQNGGSTCPGLALIDFRNTTCQNPLPACGDAFCQNKAAGSYSKSLLTTNTATACYRQYLRCSGAPQNKLTFHECVDADYIFHPSSNTCERGQGPNCPQCSGSVDGFFALSFISHDCQKYVNCTNEFSTILTCGKISFNGEERETYFNPTTRTCQRLPSNPHQFCNPVVGYWSAWKADGNGCRIRNSGNCQTREIRVCDDPQPFNVANSCPGPSEKFTNCATGSCGDAFCIGKAAGSYSKSLLFPNSPKLACFAEYYICSGEPTNKLTITKCVDQDYIFHPTRGCERGDADPNCPNAKCSAKADGFYDFSFTQHDCRQYVECKSELATVLTCTNDPTTGRPRYWNRAVNPAQCTLLPRDPSLCTPVFGFWSAWGNADASCARVNGDCKMRQIRTCSNPSPVNDATACNGQTQETRFVDCSSCPAGCSTNPCPSTATCTDVTGGTYTCTCKPGYTPRSGSGSQNTIICDDINECVNNPLICGSTRRCSNTVGAHTCLADYCQNNANPCTGSNAVCQSIHTGLGYQCGCRSGYSLSGSGNTVTCTDINECQTIANNGGCGLTSVCENLAGTYRCLPEYCGANANPCSANYLCQSTNVSPGYRCSCPTSGFTEVTQNNVKVCLDVNECQTNNGGCGTTRVCTNLLGAFRCEVEYCANKANPCTANYQCRSVSTAPGYSCFCPGPGFEEVTNNNVKSCVDINECTRNTHNCGNGQVCQNTIGSFTCSAAGCSTNPCPSTATCTDVTGGSYTCACKTGYVKRSGSGSQNTIICDDVNECQTNNGGCGLTRVCTNLVGSVRCEVEYCANNNNPCSANYQCVSTNIVPGYRCNCPSGFQEVTNNNVKTCVDVNECLTNNGGCAINRVCTNLLGAFRCEPVYCTNNANPCTDANAVCTSVSTTPGFTCVCPSGYTSSGSGANVVCTKIVVSDCTGKAANARVADPNDAKQYFLCNGNGGHTVVKCPNANLPLGIDADFNEILVPNGVWFHPSFMTCVNTTTNVAPAPITITNGEPDYAKACQDMPNFVNAQGTQTAAQLPLDPENDPKKCYYWLTCFNQKLLNDQQNPPIAGFCNSQGYDRDLRTCNPTNRFECPVV